MQTELWIWDGSAFHYYETDGRAKNLPANSFQNININGSTNWYYLLAGGKPFVGLKDTTFSTEKANTTLPRLQALQIFPAKCRGINGAISAQKYGTRWLYFANDGRYVQKGCGAYKLIPSRDILYVLDKNGYLVRTELSKAPTDITICPTDMDMLTEINL